MGSAGAEAAPEGDGPRWWVEARAAAGVDRADELAGAFAARLTMLLTDEAAVVLQDRPVVPMTS
ncbi:hypothetical protein OG338_24910 [Streptomyces sp. NBC_00726]|uniref:hypothetical protein n=1 Tax=Streptomyces sp. NBC_00726 TaxID=2903674 RepID=UPI00386C1585